MPVISVVIPRLKTNQLRWTFSGAFEVCFNQGSHVNEFVSPGYMRYLNYLTRCRGVQRKFLLSALPETCCHAALLNAFMIIQINEATLFKLFAKLPSNI